MSSCSRKVSWRQMIVGHSCVSYKSSSLIFDFNPWQFHWIIFDPWLMNLIFRFGGFFAWFVCSWFQGLTCPLFLVSQICFVSGLVLFLFFVVVFAIFPQVGFVYKELFFWIFVRLGSGQYCFACEFNSVRDEFFLIWFCIFGLWSILGGDNSLARQYIDTLFFP